MQFESVPVKNPRIWLRRLSEKIQTTEKLGVKPARSSRIQEQVLNKQEKNE